MVGIQNQHSVLIFTDAGGEGSVGFLHRFAIVGEVSKKDFFRKHLKFTFVQATQYNTEDAFGCNKCPGELLKGESEDDYEEIIILENFISVTEYIWETCNTQRRVCLK